METSKPQLQNGLKKWLLDLASRTSSEQILTLTEITESIDWNINFRGDQVNLKIPIETGKAIFLNDHFANSDNDIKQTVINLVINQAFRETKLK